MIMKMMLPAHNMSINKIFKQHREVLGTNKTWSSLQQMYQNMQPVSKLFGLNNRFLLTINWQYFEINWLNV
mgnify:CR=1 FL=1